MPPRIIIACTYGCRNAMNNIWSRPPTHRGNWTLDNSRIRQLTDWSTRRCCRKLG